MTESLPPTFLRAQQNYLATLKSDRIGPVGLFLARAAHALWSRFPGHLSLIVAVLLTTLVCRYGLASEGKWITVEATAYCPCEICCKGSADGITADGSRTDHRPYGVAASRTLALGSIVRIPVGYGYLDSTMPTARDFKVDDRGAALDSDDQNRGIPRLDLRYKNHWSARQFGRKLMMVFILN